jgi:DNA-binding beta-propeller fold protein YncE
MDWYAGNILSVTSEYYGVEKTIEKEFEVFKGKAGTSGSYGAGAAPCALVAPVSLNSNGENETQPHGITFSESGTKMFMTGNADDVFEYDLTEAYCIDNVSTPLKKDIEITGSGNPTGIVFDPSGTKLFVVDKFSDKVYQFGLTVPWLVTTVNATAGGANHSYDNPISFSITDQEKTAEGITFAPGGHKMFIVGAHGTNKGEVNSYNLSEPYLITSASHAYVYTMSFTDANPSGIIFSESGLKMFISDAGTDTIREYELTIPYLLSSNSTGDADTPSLSMSAVGSTVRDLWFDASGTKLFILEQGARDVTVYELTVPYLLESATIVS